MPKKYIVRLSDKERNQLRAVVRKLSGSSQKVRRAQILMKADAAGANWTDPRIAEAFDCRTKTVEDVRKRLVERGFEETLNGKKRRSSPTPKRFDGHQEAQVKEAESSELISIGAMPIVHPKTRAWLNVG